MRRRRQRSGPSKPTYNTATWRAARELARRRDRNACIRCGSTHKLSVHHLVPLRLGGTHNLANLATLCATCHAATDAAMRPRKRARKLARKLRW